MRQRVPPAFMNLIIFDLETTGLLPSQHEIIQIAAMKVKNGKWNEGEYFDSYVRPENRIPSFITKLTGITQAQVADAPHPVDVLMEFSRFVGHDATLIAHNGLRFDMRFIAENCKRLGMKVVFYDDVNFPSGSAGGRRSATRARPCRSR